MHRTCVYVFARLGELSSSDFHVPFSDGTMFASDGPGEKAKERTLFNNIFLK